MIRNPALRQEWQLCPFTHGIEDLVTINSSAGTLVLVSVHLIALGGFDYVPVIRQALPDQWSKQQKRIFTEARQAERKVLRHPRELSEDEWQKEGESLFGPDQKHWAFVCPCCGNCQMPVNFQAYKAQGAEPDTAYLSCIGRFSGAVRRAFGGSGPGPCDYTCGGLFNVNPVVVTRPDGSVVRCFEFER